MQCQTYLQNNFTVVCMDRGAGATLALVVMFMFSKSQYLKSLGRLGFLPGLFNINEPIIFGAPIVMNPILGIPFIIGPIIMTILSYVLTITGLYL